MQKQVCARPLFHIDSHAQCVVFLDACGYVLRCVVVVVSCCCVVVWCVLENMPTFNCSALSFVTFPRNRPITPWCASMHVVHDVPRIDTFVDAE